MFNFFVRNYVPYLLDLTPISFKRPWKKLSLSINAHVYGRGTVGGAEVARGTSFKHGSIE